MTARDIPHDSPCPVCRTAAERVAELESLVANLSDRLAAASAALSRVAERANTQKAKDAALARRHGAANVALLIEAGEG